jgi:ribosomal protein S18 acetylase RimI-like enzyme
VSEPPCRLVEWDTEFWGMRIARVQGDAMNGELRVAVDTWCAENGISCAYFLATTEAPATTLAAERGGFFYTDVRVTLRQRLDSNRRPVRPGRIRAGEKEDIPELREIARVSHKITRFYHDPHFADERCGELYADWIRSSFEGEADEVLVAEDDGRVAGYITCVIKERVGHMGLLAVAPGHQERGLGQDLVDGALDWFAAARVAESAVVTQGRNIAALRLFGRAAYLVDSMQLWFHKWYDR